MGLLRSVVFADMLVDQLMNQKRVEVSSTKQASGLKPRVESTTVRKVVRRCSFLFFFF